MLLKDYVFLFLIRVIFLWSYSDTLKVQFLQVFVTLKQRQSIQTTDRARQTGQETNKQTIDKIDGRNKTGLLWSEFEMKHSPVKKGDIDR